MVMARLTRALTLAALCFHVASSERDLVSIKVAAAQHMTRLQPEERVPALAPTAPTPQLNREAGHWQHGMAQHAGLVQLQEEEPSAHFSNGAAAAGMQHQKNEKRGTEPSGLQEVAKEAVGEPDRNEFLGDVVQWKRQWTKPWKTCVNTNTGKTVTAAEECDKKCCCKKGWKRKQGDSYDFEQCERKAQEVLYADQSCPRKRFYQRMPGFSTHSEDCSMQGGDTGKCCCVANYMVLEGKCVKFNQENMALRAHAEEHGPAGDFEGPEEAPNEAEGEQDGHELLSDVVQWKRQWMKPWKTCVNTRTGKTVTAAEECNKKCCCKKGWKKKQGDSSDFEQCERKAQEVLYADQACPRKRFYQRMPGFSTHTEDCLMQGGDPEKCCCMANYMVLDGQCVKFSQENMALRAPVEEHGPVVSFDDSDE